MNLLNTPMSRVSCPNDENPENQADQPKAFFHKKERFTVNQILQRLTFSIVLNSCNQDFPRNSLTTPCQGLVVQMMNDEIAFCVKMP